MAATYGETTVEPIVKRVGCPDGQHEFTAFFTTAGAGAAVVDSAKTRGVISVLRTGAGVFEVTLPYSLRNCNVQATLAAHPASAILNLLKCAHVENAKVVTLTSTVISTGAAGDTTDVAWSVRIIGSKS
jgi:hypothetical protein